MPLPQFGQPKSMHPLSPEAGQAVEQAQSQRLPGLIGEIKRIWDERAGQEQVQSIANLPGLKQIGQLGTMAEESGAEYGMMPFGGALPLLGIAKIKAAKLLEKQIKNLANDMVKRG